MKINIIESSVHIVLLFLNNVKKSGEEVCYIYIKNEINIDIIDYMMFC